MLVPLTIKSTLYEIVCNVCMLVPLVLVLTARREGRKGVRREDRATRAARARAAAVPREVVEEEEGLGFGGRTAAIPFRSRPLPRRRLGAACLAPRAPVAPPCAARIAASYGGGGDACYPYSQNHGAVIRIPCNVSGKALQLDLLTKERKFSRGSTQVKRKSERTVTERPEREMARRRRHEYQWMAKKGDTEINGSS